MPRAGTAGGPWLWMTHAGTETPLSDWVLEGLKYKMQQKTMGDEPGETGMKEASLIFI